MSPFVPKPGAGFFTWMAMLFDLDGAALEAQIGFSPGTLSEGWHLLTTVDPIPAPLIVLEGHARFSGGMMDDGRRIESAIAEAYAQGGA